MSLGASSSELLEYQSTRQTSNFNYGAVETETQIVIQQLTNEIKTLMRRNAQEIIEIGQKLTEVKQYLGHGSFINWLKSEFSWSISTATKFMQVWEQFKFVNFTNLNITASALYLIAAPSSPKVVRAEALERASSGENISYTKAKEIICQHKKTVDVSAKTTECEDSTSIKPLQYKASAAFSAPEVLTEKEVEIETPSLSFQDLMPFSESSNSRTATIISTQTSVRTLNHAATSCNMTDILTTEIAASIINLTSEQLTLVLKKSVNNGLSEEII